jgi:outer membrane protein assembly factor BamB
VWVAATLAASAGSLSAAQTAGDVTGTETDAETQPPAAPTAADAEEPAGTQAPLQVVWEAGIGQGATAPPAVLGDRLFVATTRKDVKAFDLATGREIWSSDLARGFQASPVPAGPALLVAAPHPDAKALGLNPATGEVLWEREIGDLAQAPVVESGVAVFVSQNGRVAALDVATGEPRWRTRQDGVFTGGLALSGDDLLVLSAAGVLHRLDARSGEPRGSVELGGGAVPALLGLPDGSGVLAATHAGRVRAYGFDLSTRPLELSVTPMVHPPALATPHGGADPRLIVPGADKVLRAYALAGGAIQWERAFDVAFAARPAVSADGARIAVGDLAGIVWTLDAASGEILSRTPTPGGAAVPVWTPEGRLAVVTSRGSLMLLATTSAA